MGTPTNEIRRTKQKLEAIGHPAFYWVAVDLLRRLDELSGFPLQDDEDYIKVAVLLKTDYQLALARLGEHPAQGELPLS